MCVKPVMRLFQLAPVHHSVWHDESQIKIIGLRGGGGGCAGSDSLELQKSGSAHVPICSKENRRAIFGFPVCKSLSQLESFCSVIGAGGTRSCNPLAGRYTHAHFRPLHTRTLSPPPPKEEQQSAFHQPPLPLHTLWDQFPNVLGRAFCDIWQLPLLEGGADEELILKEFLVF
uniref:Uncharacterized protein n=1 Tax=Sphaerodactylus townsendi TaxID=933632 RepID=A0ACB8EXH5_9SAUR